MHLIEGSTKGTTTIKGPSNLCPPFVGRLEPVGVWSVVELSEENRMARTDRRDVLAEGEIQVVHCINRCVAQPEKAVLRRNEKHRFAS